MKKIFIALVGMATAMSSVFATDRYVALNGAHVSPFTNWATAATGIQYAISACSSGDVVWVTNGTYEVGEFNNPYDTVKCRISITNAITVRSVNGATNTTIKGGTPIRAVWMGSNSSLSGFTIRDGNLSGSSDPNPNGPGIQYPYDDWTQTSPPWTPGDWLPTNINVNARVYNCIIRDNLNGKDGGGAHGFAVFHNCLFTGNSCTYGGGASCAGIFYNCVAVSNSSGIRYGYIYNSIMRENAGDNYPQAYLITNSCSPGLTGNNNITADPQFIDSGSDNYRLQATSPCINAGSNQNWMLTATDLDGNDRIISSIVDMGAYEYNGSATVPQAPENIQASDGTYADKVRITWSAASGATGYRIFRHTSANSASADQIGTTASTTYDDTNAVADATYYYWVKATNLSGASAFSSYDTGYRTPSTSTLTAPTNVSASDGTYTNKILVTWTAISGAGNYEVWRNTLASTNGASQIADTATNTHNDTNVTANVSYYYWVRAKNPVATSEFSLPDSGYASMGNASSGSADLSMLSFLFLPTVLSIGDHPGAVSVQLINYGPDDLVSPNTRVAFHFYLSANAVFGDADDVWFGNYSCDKTLGASSYTTVVVPSAGREELMIPTGLTSGNYCVFIRVQHESPSTLLDPDLSNNHVIRDGVISITGSSEVGYHLFNDYDNDGKSDVALYKESTGEWLILLSGSGYAPQSVILGGAGFKPVLADYDGDGKSDPAVCKKSTGDWKIMMSANSYEITLLVFGENGCMPVSMDYDGDGKADPTVYREAAGTWEIMCSADNYAALTVGFGGNGRTPVPADYDGDGISDLATYRDSTGDWAVMLSSLGYWTLDFNFGGHGTTPVPADYDGDGKADPAVYKETSGDWSVMLSRFNYLPASGSFGGQGWVPVHADYDGDGKEDIAIYNDDQHMLKVLVSGSDYGLITLEVGGPGYEPVGWPQ